MPTIKGESLRYCRRVSPKGRVSYKIAGCDLRCNPLPADGIWRVSKGSHRLVTERLDDLPKIKRICALEEYRDRVVHELINAGPMSLDDQVSLVFEVIQEAVE